jgi:ribonuclease P protein component
MKRRSAIRGSCFELRHLDSSGRFTIGSEVGVTVCARLGLVIGKRYARHAVLRNLIKRQIREVFRGIADQLPPEDFVLRMMKPLPELPITRQQQRQWVRAEIESLFARVRSTPALP